MKIVVKKSKLAGTVSIPGSKSHTIRAVAIASLADGQSAIRNPLVSEDTLSAVDCYRALGARINTTNEKMWEVGGTGGRLSVPEKIIDVGNSGTTLRIAVGSAALLDRGATVTFTGDEQIRSRPIGPLLSALKDLGANGRSVNNNGKPPVEISGKLTGGATSIEAVTSQYLSSLLMAAPLTSRDTIIDVPLLNEPDYVQMTLDWLNKQQIKYENNRMRSFRIEGGQKYKAFDESIPADFSSATFFLCAAAIAGGDVTLTGLDFSDSQPDKAVVDYLRSMGADISIAEAAVRIKGSKLTGTEIDMNRTPDALPAMAVVGAFAAGATKLVNVAQARSKETDRISCMAAELKKMGADVEELPDGLIIRNSRLEAARLDGRSDHRIVMALALAGLAIEGQTVVDTAEAMNITFPDYVKLMKNLGAEMILVD
ncbi:MAG TPA: 3-phosphoshikimate 1-carboxyvinyltransferase [Planctomycetes bacterium]|nr:3-phosphoshikimate 1-carboxyvinyltransferase [Planctomycetota bacterium]HIJ71202.1 3-phosphoshikimate 1-carboxyvinyltransferase [Planctomycetota bacterium]